MEVIVFMGQSNMQGSTGEYDYSHPVKNGFEYKFYDNKIVPLVNPVGEFLGDDVLGGSGESCGSLVPHFVREYIKRKKTEVVAIHTARGATRVAEWLKGTERFELATKKIKAGLEKIKEKYTIDKVSVVWLQGESDATDYLSTSEYEERIIKLKNDLKSEFSFSKFGIISIGYFTAYVKWVNGTFEEKKKADEDIMKAQENVCKKDADFVYLTDVCKKLSVNKKYLNPKEGGPHYNNRGMKIIGKKAGKALSRI